LRRQLVKAIAEANPAFIAIAGDISYKADEADWRIWDTETIVWREKRIPVYPALGNHDLEGDQKTALANYFSRFPEIKSCRYYSVRIENVLLLVLDSSLEETSGPQGQWFRSKLDTLSSDVDFLVIVMHHPPYTSSSDAKTFGGGHSARPEEQAFARVIESTQALVRPKIVVITGHIHNYERHQHDGVTYFVSGGGGAHAYPIERAPDDPFHSKVINYHYLLVTVDHEKMSVAMNRLELGNGLASWTKPDSVVISAPPAAAPSK
jgi:Icc-related predicted phosphoesterase